jgi:autotransporter translocation and assembly factor TamB
VLGLDTIEVSAGGQLGSGSIKVGRYVTQDLFLSVEQDIGQASADSGPNVGRTSGGTKAGLEYSINRRLKVRGSSSDRGETAADFLWRLDY